MLAPACTFEARNALRGRASVRHGRELFLKKASHARLDAIRFRETRVTDTGGELLCRAQIYLLSMGTRKPKKNAGISRIDQLEKRTHGFFVRLARKGKIHNAFFADKSYGGKRKALEAARKHYQELLRKHGKISRRDWAQMERCVTSSGIVGVRKTVIVRNGQKKTVWIASWSPKPYVVRRKLFSVEKYGPRDARALAIKARQGGLKSMSD